MKNRRKTGTLDARRLHVSLLRQTLQLHFLEHLVAYMRESLGGLNLAVQKQHFSLSSSHHHRSSSQSATLSS